MAKLFYVGFNGYSQCPTQGTFKDGLPNVITTWTCIPSEGVFNACCTHRALIVETKNKFFHTGLIDDVTECKEIEKPCDFEGFNSCEDYLMAYKGLMLWVYTYKDSKWKKLNLILSGEEEANIWNDDGNRICKLSFRTDTTDTFVLLSSGSVWTLNDQCTMELLYPHDTDRAIDVTSGLEHTLILTESGCVLSFGNGSRGQLGNGALNSTATPVQVGPLEGLKIIKIAAGNWHSCAITDAGDLCTWGWNNFGQLAALEEDEEVGLTATPIFVAVGEDQDNAVLDVVCGSRHTVAKLATGDLYASGWNAYGQLGLQRSDEKTSKFEMCTLRDNQNRRLLAGSWYTILLEV
ncbi:hypothetical protein RUM43_012854 [Polyplax serrata]|uniref:RCC1 domain-containing protein 1 n=1 Tax=Polyplax serrata TaxID=468196 RepID=A0AAN8PID5_POLSC